MRGWRGLSSRSVLVLVGAVLVAGCGTTTVIKTVTTSAPAVNSAATATATAPVSAATTAASTASTPRPRQARVGSTLTLTGNGGESLAVTVDQVMDPLPVGQDDQADAGQRYVGIQITLKNVGSVPYSDAPSNGSTLLSNSSDQAQGTIVTGGPCGNDFQSSVKIAPSESQHGCIPFELVQGKSAATFQFTLDSGFANQTGQWSLAGAPTGSASPASPSSASTASTTTASSVASSSASSGSDPLALVSSYWQGIDSQQFAAAYADLAPGSVNVSQGQFVSQEQQAGIKSATFTGHVSSNSDSLATVAVDALTVTDAQFGCRNWSGSYQLASQGGQWLIQRADITPSSCG